MKKTFFCIALLCVISQAAYSQIVSLVKDINPNGDAEISWMTAFHDKLIFSANNGVVGRELWVSNGTESGTYMIKDIGIGKQSSPQNIYTVHNGAYFQAITDAYGTELYFTDGTDTGTRLVKDIDQTTIVKSGSFPRGFKEYAGKVYFFAQNRGRLGVFVTDGTDTGTRELRHCNYGTGGPCSGYGFNIYKGKMYYSGSSILYGNELFYFDSTADDNVTLVKDIYVGSISSSPSNYLQMNGQLYFTATDVINGKELWSTDGTDTGTQILYDINRKGDSNPTSLMLLDKRILFSADDSVNGVELWSTNGDSATTVLLKDINPNGNSNPSSLFKFNNKVLFAADDNMHGTELWITDGTSGGTTLLKDLLPGVDSSMPDRFVEFKGWVFFRAKDSLGYQLWKTDGTPLGTQIIKPKFSIENSPLENSYFVATDSTLFLYANYDTNKGELYKIEVNTPLSSKQVNALNDPNIMIYPNPTKFETFISVGSSCEDCLYEIVDIQGVVLDRGFINGNVTRVYMGNKAQGIYFVKVYGKISVVSKKLIKL